MTFEALFVALAILGAIAIVAVTIREVLRFRRIRREIELMPPPHHLTAEGEIAQQQRLEELRREVKDWPS